MNIKPLHPPLSANTRGPADKSTANAAPAHDILTDRWPALLTAMQDYKRQIADDFSALAYRCVTDGLIRFDDRRRLAKAAARANIRPFDAQLLIACAIRQWTLDQGKARLSAHRKKSPAQPKPRMNWKTWTLLAGTAAALDAILIWNWLS